jgi:signal transduction histidine kinase
VSVRDHGIGMNEEARARAFERFFRSDRSGHIPGTGLGLSLVQEIMNIHGGRVDLDSEPDRGTCVTLWFPLADAGSVPIAEPAAAHT